MTQALLGNPLVTGWFQVGLVLALILLSRPFLQAFLQPGALLGSRQWALRSFMPRASSALSSPRAQGKSSCQAPSSFFHREKLDSFLPAHLCKRGHGLFAALRGRGAKAGPVEQGLLDAYRRVQDVGDSEASLSPHYRAYLLKCHELPFYG